MAGAATLAAYGLVRSELHVDLAEARTVATIVLFWLGLVVLDLVAAPLRLARRALMLALAGMFVAVMTIPPLRSFFALALPSSIEWLAAFGVGVLVASVLRFFVPTGPGWPTMKGEGG
jgi:cation-transporting ATPase E